MVNDAAAMYNSGLFLFQPICLTAIENVPLNRASDMILPPGLAPGPVPFPKDVIPSQNLCKLCRIPLHSTSLETDSPNMPFVCGT